MIFYDFEVFEKDWLAVFIDVTNKKEHVIINSPDKLKALYEANRKDIWVGFNNRHYDQYIMKGILLGMNPKKINDWIIVDNKEGWQYSRVFNKLPMINYDVMPSNDETMKTVGLKTMEGFLGSNIKETDVDFRIKRKLTPEEIEQTVKYCRHDVEQTIKVFLEKVSEFNAVHGIIQAFPKETSLYDIGDSEARITAKVLGCSKTHFGDEFDFFFLPCLKLKKYKYVQEWFAEKRKEALEMGLQDFDKKDKKTWYKSQNFETVVAGIPHTFGFGGLHGASDKPIHRKGQILHVDVNNYYPSMLIAWGLVTRAATNNNFKLVYDTRKATFTGTSFQIYNNRSIDFYSPLNLHGWGYTNNSDVRLKTNIKDTAIRGLEVVNAIDLKEFDWIQSGEHQAIGIIAQQIQSFAPELISEDASDGHLKLNTDKLVYYCIKAIQELCEKEGMRYSKPIYKDPYTYLEKKTFIAKMPSQKYLESEPYEREPIILPKRRE